MDNKGAVNIPPTIGAAMRCITSDPAPLPSRIGESPARITAVIPACRATTKGTGLLVSPDRARARRTSSWLLRKSSATRMPSAQPTPAEK